MLREPDKLFQATSQHLWDTVTRQGGPVGFRVPEYQRRYDWDTGNLKRLLEDCLNGFQRLSQREVRESYTFLGTIILVNEESSEISFDGTSLSIVDGQQRLTTLSLLACALTNEIRTASQMLTGLQRSGTLPALPLKWLLAERDLVISRLFKCSNGQLEHRNDTIPFPRIVRQGDDNRSAVRGGSEYKSGIARFLWAFSSFFEQHMWNDEHVAGFQPESDESDRVLVNYRYLERQVRDYLRAADDQRNGDDSGELDCEVVRRQSFNRSGFRDLFGKLDSVGDESQQNAAMSLIAEESASEGLVRLLLFSWYFLKCVVLTRVETDNEERAFDIFDSLNTTGQPLTAIETLKPYVMKWERQRTGYPGSESERQFARITEHLDEPLENDTLRRQEATRDLLVSFALLYSGEKRGRDLRVQREHLRKEFREASGKGPEDALLYLRTLADLAEFKRYYWDDPERLHPDHHRSGTDGAELLQLCLMFMSATKTTLAIPALARYWIQYTRDHDEDTLVAATQSITAFIAIRRSVTGGTSGIDSELRAIMSEINVGGHSRAFSNDYLSAKLRDHLRKSRIGVTNKKLWVAKTEAIALAAHSRPLCRFLLLAAADGAMPDGDGFLTREGVNRTDELKFFSPRVWGSEKYGTVEHVAPASNPHQDWDRRFYDDGATYQTIGNPHPVATEGELRCRQRYVAEEEAVLPGPSGEERRGSEQSDRSGEEAGLQVRAANRGATEGSRPAPHAGFGSAS